MPHCQPCFITTTSSNMPSRLMKAACLLLLAVLLLVPASARGEIVNVLPKADRGEEGLFASLTLPLEWRTGNTNLLRFGGTADLLWVQQKNAFLMALSGDYGRTSGETYLSRHFQHLRYRRTLTPRVGAESYVQHSADEFRRLSLRLVTGGGPYMTLLQWRSGDVTLGVAYMAEWEQFTTDEGAEDSGDSLFTHRISSYLRLGIKVADNLSLSSTTFAQPALSDFGGDIRISSDTALRVKASDHFYFQTSVALTYNTRVPSSVERFDTAVISAVGLSL